MCHHWSPCVGVDCSAWSLLTAQAALDTAACRSGLLRTIRGRKSRDSSNSTQWDCFNFFLSSGDLDPHLGGQMGANRLEPNHRGSGEGRYASICLGDAGRNHLFLKGLHCCTQ